MPVHATVNRFLGNIIDTFAVYGDMLGNIRCLKTHQRKACVHIHLLHVRYGWGLSRQIKCKMWLYFCFLFIYKRFPKADPRRPSQHICKVWMSALGSAAATAVHSDAFWLVGRGNSNTPVLCELCYGFTIHMCVWVQEYMKSHKYILEMPISGNFLTETKQ